MVIIAALLNPIPIWVLVFGPLGGSHFSEVGYTTYASLKKLSRKAKSRWMEKENYLLNPSALGARATILSTHCLGSYLGLFSTIGCTMCYDPLRPCRVCSGHAWPAGNSGDGRWLDWPITHTWEVWRIKRTSGHLSLSLSLELTLRVQTFKPPRHVMLWYLYGLNTYALFCRKPLSSASKCLCCHHELAVT